MAPKDSSSGTKNRKSEKKDEYLSEEDLALKEQLELYVKMVQDSDPKLQKDALERLRQETRTVTSSMTSIQKVLKFLRPHYRVLQAYYGDIEDSNLQNNGELIDNDLLKLVEQIVVFYMKQNAEHEAVDLIMEAEDYDMLVEHVDDVNYKRACLYLTSLAKYHQESSLILDFAYRIYMNFEDFHRALQIALHLNEMQYVKEVFTSCNDLLKKQQFCYILARHGVTFEIDDEICEEDEEMESLQQIINNAKLSEGFLTLARDIEVMEPKSPEDIYKYHLLDGRARDRKFVDSGREKLAATFVNAFVNAGFGQDKLMIGPVEASSGGSATSWVLENKEHGQASATASLGMILLWDVDYGLAQIDKYIRSTNTHIIAGALLGVGILNCRVNKNCYILSDYVHDKESSIRIGAIMGLGIAYAGSQDEQISSILNSILEDSKESLDVIAFSAVSLGLVHVGSCSEYFAETITLTLKTRNASELGEPLFRLLPLGLGLLYLGKQDNVNTRATTLLETFNEKIGKYCYMTLISCAYAGTGDALKVQKFLHACEHLKNGEKYQGPAVLGIAMVAMAEELGLEMAIRSLEHLLQYGNHNIRTAVPLALGLLCISNPKVKVIDTLRRLSKDRDTGVAMAAVIALGLIGAGTNNAKIAGWLRNLSTSYALFPSLLFCVRIAQGLVYLGKGLLTLSPYHSERFLLSPTALAGLVILLHACLDLGDTILWKCPCVLYFLVLAIQPRMLMTVDENLKPLSVPVRVGQAVDVVGQAGCPKTITGFRTLPTPVILSAGERAELATERQEIFPMKCSVHCYLLVYNECTLILILVCRYVPLSPILEGFVILKENPDYRDDH
ncbi:unnamed protein product [Fraxinus pennsylvanica]|uniref:26S proteasome non-ATPase regulatory subunit 2 homolog n=1 Tax=Fraxinus pennsylvanica TaxID=56036 RepID=A0AAD2E228_9LAMI|nr:unnamed protein product [Fraxinus pennsylvanica]